MKKVFYLALLLMLLNSCNTNTLKGKVVYVFHFTNLTITEYQMKFITDEIVEIRTTLSANSFECYTYKNTPELTKEVKMYHYSYKDHILEMPEIRLITKLTGNDLHQSSNEVVYTSSIVEVLDDKNRVEEILRGTSEANNTEMYLAMLSNNNEPLLIEEHGMYKSNPKNIHNKATN